MRNVHILLLLVIMTAGCGESFEHDTGLATKRAVEFAETAFVRGNIEQGHALLADNARGYVPLDKFAEKVNSMHRSGRPTQVSGVSATPVRGDKLVKVKVRGSGAGPFDYDITLAGTAASDYRVTIFSRQ